MSELEPSFESFKYLSPEEKQNFITSVAMSDAESLLGRYFSHDMSRIPMNEEELGAHATVYFNSFIFNLGSELTEQEQEEYAESYFETFIERFMAGKKKRNTDTNSKIFGYVKKKDRSIN